MAHGSHGANDGVDGDDDDAYGDVMLRVVATRDPNATAPGGGHTHLSDDIGFLSDSSHRFYTDNYNCCLSY